MATWLQRRKAHRRLRDRVGLWYHPQYKVEALGETARVPGVEVARGEKILGSLGAEGLVRPKQVRPAPIVRLTDLAKAHSETTSTDGRARVPRAHLRPRAHDIDVDPVLIGAAAAGRRHASKRHRGHSRNERVAFNIGGGFHHAEPEAGAGFCVYNDIAVAIAVLRDEGFDAPIAIVDLDYHQGNGNIVTFEDDETVFTYSIHGSVWSHVEAAADEQFLIPPRPMTRRTCTSSRETLPAMLERSTPD